MLLALLTWLPLFVRAETGTNPHSADTSSARLPASIADFVDQHCIACHGNEASEGGLNLPALGVELSDQKTFAQWQRVLQRVRDQEMPPASEAQPGHAELKKFMSALKQPLFDFDAADVVENGRVRGRRLTRTEYEHTLHDLLGIDIPLKTLLPEDSGSHGFETVADGQQLSHHLLAVYLDVADLALQHAFDRALNGDVRYHESFTPDELAHRGRGNNRSPESRDGKSISWPITLQFFGRMYSTRVPEDGWYRIKLKGVHAVNPNENGSVWGTLRSGWCESNAPLLYMIGLVEATETPRELVFEAWIRDRHCLELKPNDAELARAPTGAKGGNVSFKGRDLADDGFSGIAHHGIDIERIYPNADQATLKRNLFGDLELSQVAGDEADAALVELATRFAGRAFRRPVTEDVVAPYIKIGRELLNEGNSLNEAIRASYRAILCSPRFLTFIEPPGRLDDYAVASRLSYALWTSPPDDRLLKIAGRGKLQEPDVLAEQVERMLADSKSKRFIDSYTDQWLKLNQIDFTTPETRMFRTFDPVLQESMVQETKAFMDELVRANRSVTSLIDSDFVFLNERLARHYRMSPGDYALRTGEGMQQVLLESKDTPRGGLLTQGAILKVTADGTRTSPIVRGVFVNERILGERVSPPPPGVPAIEPDIRGAVSIRDQLDKHRSDESCSACHRIIDPPGFALENFDPIGGWRDHYGNRGEGVAVDASGTTVQGKPFATLADWKRITRQRREQLARTFAEHFLTYSTGAAIRLSDNDAVDEIVASTGDSDFGIRALIRASVSSPIFLNK